MKLGAFDYLTKPCKLIELETLLDRVAARYQEILAAAGALDFDDLLLLL